MQHRAELTRWTPLVYLVIGQIGWFVCVVTAARRQSWIGVTLALPLLLLHLARVARPLQELKFVLGVAVIGGIWESLMVHFGVLTYPGGEIVDGFAPGWIVMLWALFAAQFNTTYRWLKNRPVAAMLLGMIAGPLSFRAGAALGALNFVKPGSGAVVLGIGWGVLLPAIVLLSRRWNGVQVE